MCWLISDLKLQKYPNLQQVNKMKQQAGLRNTVKSMFTFKINFIY